MTLFEYLSVATSIVLALSAAQLLTNLRSVMHRARRYWVHVLWIFLLLLGHLLVWWEFWGYRDVTSWNFAKFTLMLLNPGILFVCSNTLVHSESKVDKPWDEHFYQVRRSFFAVFGMLPLVSVLRRWSLADIPILSPNNFPELLVFLPFCVAGFAFKSRRIHASLVRCTTGFLGCAPCSRSSSCPRITPI